MVGRGAFSSRCVRGTWIAVGAGGALVIACGGEPEPVSVSLGEPISIGRFTLEVLRAEPVPEPPPPINVFRTREDEKGLIVHVLWRNLDGLDPLERRVFAEQFLESRLTIVDHAGDRRRPVSAMQRSLLRMRDPGGDWRNWSVVFHVFKDSRSPVLIVENPGPGSGQPAAVSLDLGLWEDE